MTADEPVAYGDAVYAGSAGGRLVSLDLGGGLKWEAQLSGDIRSPSIDRQGNLYCSGSGLTLYACGADGESPGERIPRERSPWARG